MITWLASWPRSGNTLLRLLLHRGLGLSTYTLHATVPGADAVRALTGQQDLPPDAIARPDLHCVKTHEAPGDGSPTIYVVRDGRDAACSYRAYLRDLRGEDVSLGAVIRGECPFGSWSAHVRAWDPLRRPRTLLLRYEDLARDPDAALARLAPFLGVAPRSFALPAFAELHATVPSFFRRGAPGGWGDEMSDAEEALFWARHGSVMGELGYARRP